MTDTALVTGGFGLVGTQTVDRLAAAGRRVVVADLDTPANRKKARTLPDGVDGALGGPDGCRERSVGSSPRFRPR